MNIRDSIFRYSPPCVKRKVGLAVGNVSLLECSSLLSLSWSSHASFFSMKSLVIWMFLLFFTIKVFLQVIVPRKSRIFIWFFASWNSHDKWHLAQRKTWFQSFSHLCVTGRSHEESLHVFSYIVLWLVPMALLISIGGFLLGGTIYLCTNTLYWLWRFCLCQESNDVMELHKIVTFFGNLVGPKCKGFFLWQVQGPWVRMG